MKPDSDAESEADDRHNSSSNGGRTSNGDPNPPTPNWQPIEQLGLIGWNVDDMLEADTTQYQTLLKARLRPHVLDDHTVKRVIEVYTIQLDGLWLFDEQLARWTAQVTTLTPAQNQEVKRLIGQMVKLHQVVNSILELAQELKQGTIERVQAKSDLELGLEILRKSHKAN